MGSLALVLGLALMGPLATFFRLLVFKESANRVSSALTTILTDVFLESCFGDPDGSSAAPPASNNAGFLGALVDSSSIVVAGAGTGRSAFFFSGDDDGREGSGFDACRDWTTG